MKLPLRFVLPAVMALSAGACATTNATVQHPIASAPNAANDEAERRYQAAMELFRDESWPEAIEAFRTVTRGNATSRQATLAELRLAEIEFRQERYTEALAAFRAWLRYHPAHAEASFARFMIARCHVEQMPEDWFLTPPSWERDLSSAHDAETALARFVRDHGASEHAPEAQRQLRRVRQILARHEVYVADFYSGRDRYNAAASRLLGVLANFHDSGLEPLAALRLGEVYLRMNRAAEARGAFQYLTETFAQSAEADAARAHLARLGPGPSTPVRPEGAPDTEDTGHTEDVESSVDRPEAQP